MPWTPKSVPSATLPGTLYLLGPWMPFPVPGASIYNPVEAPPGVYDACEVAPGVYDDCDLPTPTYTPKSV